MNLLISPDIYIHYVNSLKQPKKSQIDSDIIALINNQNNKHVLSRSLIEHIEKGFSKSIVNEVIMPLLTEIMDSNSVNITGSSSDNFVDTLLSMLENNRKSDRPHIISATVSVKEINGNINCTKLVLPSLMKPNMDWLVFKMACHNPTSITLRYSDFKNDAQIQTLFDGIVKLVKTDEQPSIFDRQINLNHNYFKDIKSKVVHYYTLKGKDKVECSERTKTITNHFKRARVYLGPSNAIHERKLIVGNYLIEADDDFWNLTVKRPTWKLDFTYCSNTVQILLNAKRETFRRFTP